MRQRSGGSWFQASMGKQFPKPPLFQKIPSQKRVDRVAQGVGPEFKLQKCKTTKKNPSSDFPGENVIHSFKITCIYFISGRKITYIGFYNNGTG
jgi:hypothetical protein